MKRLAGFVLGGTILKVLTAASVHAQARFDRVDDA